MTAGVGTSLWMAPEVMLGEWYDDKADMFSFGVLLSELDVHTLPYTNVQRNSRDSYGRQMPETVLLQQIASGKARVEFSAAGPSSITQLGYACVSIDPSCVHPQPKFLTDSKRFLLKSYESTAKKLYS
ncbi:unnamed protein product [Phytophthora lilii]|uniref:Unnamed protein product n=1 Tax=Phytophthora lilii TaxID=2077276 RepID=A0A9W6TU72_9STRA|nr:unnamed protein product [Phytophthora lilii]